MRVLFLDDCPSRTEKFKSRWPSATCCQNAFEIISEIEKEPVDILFLDHDLEGRVYQNSNEENCGMEVVRFLERYRPEVRKIVVHTLNHEAGLKMTSKLQAAGYETLKRPFTDFIYDDSKWKSLKIALGA